MIPTWDRCRSTSSQAQAERENTVRRAIDFGGVSQAAAPSLSPPPRTSLKLGGTPASGPGSTSRTPSSKNSRCPSSTPATVRRNKVVDMDAADLGSTAASPHQDYSMLSDNSTQLPSDASPFHIPSSDEKLLAPCSSSPVLSALTHRHPQHPRPSSSSTTPLRYPQARPRREASKTLAALQALIMPAASPDAAPRRSRGAQGSLSSSEGSASAILSGMVAGSTTPSGQWNGDSRGVNSHGRNKGGRGGGSIALPANYHAVLAEGAVHYKRARAWQRRSILFESFALWLSSHHETARYVSALRKTNDRQRVRRLERCMAAWVAAAGQAGRPWDALMNVACKVGEAGMERRLRGVMQMVSLRWLAGGRVLAACCVRPGAFEGRGLRLGCVCACRRTHVFAPLHTAALHPWYAGRNTHMTIHAPSCNPFHTPSHAIFSTPLLAILCTLLDRCATLGVTCAPPASRSGRVWAEGAGPLSLLSPARCPGPGGPPQGGC